MPNDPKISTKYEDVDESFDGPQNSNTEPTRRSSRSTRNQKPMNENESQLSDHDSETQDHVSESCDISHLFDDSFNSATSDNEETNQISPSILDKPPSASPPPLPSQPNMTLTAADINKLIEERVNEIIQSRNAQQTPQTPHYSPKISNIPLLDMTN